MADFTLVNVNSDWHDAFSVTLGELMEQGFDPYGDTLWTTAKWYSDDVRSSWESIFALHYKHYEIGVMPPRVWRDHLTARVLETAPKWWPWYRWLDNGGDWTVAEDVWEKNRNLFSDFPQTLLKPEEEDYAANANDYQGERMRRGNMVELLRQWRDMDDITRAWILDMKGLFSWLTTPTPQW